MWQLCDDIARAVEAGQIVDALNHDEALLTILYSAGGNPVLLEDRRWGRCRAEVASGRPYHYNPGARPGG
jgi:DNA-binding GntR family transcriptional regulator